GRAGGADVEGVGSDAGVCQLPRQLAAYLRVGGGAQDSGAWIADDVGPAPLGAQLFSHRCLGCLELGTEPALDEADLRAKQPVEEEVALEHLRLRVAAQDEETLDAEARAGGGGLAAVVALRAGALDDAVGSLRERLAEGELQLARLVPAERQAGGVVA